MKKNHFKKLIETYDKNKSLREQNLEGWIHRISEKIGVHKDIVFLALGCGDCALNTHIVEKLRYKVYSAYFSENCFKHIHPCKKNNPVEWNAQSTKKLNYPDDSFDIIFLSILFPLNDLKNILKECYRIVKNEGFIMIRYIEKKNKKDDPIYHFFPKIQENESNMQYNTSTIENMLLNAGFKNICTEKYLQQNYFTIEDFLRGIIKDNDHRLYKISKKDIEIGIKNIYKYIESNNKIDWVLNQKMNLSIAREVKKEI